MANEIEVVELLDSSEDEAAPMEADDVEVRVVDAEREIRAPEGAAGAAADDDEIVITGMVGDDALVDYPHPRHACAVFKFDTTSHITHCPNCWCYCCDVQAPCPDWAVHCDAKAGVQKWDAMRRTIQSRGAGAAAWPVQGYNAAGHNIPLPNPAPVPAIPIMDKIDEMATRPALVTQMPDPRTLLSVTRLGTVKIPIALCGGYTAAALNSKLNNGAPFGVRCLSYDTARKYIDEKMGNGNSAGYFGFLNLLNSDGTSYYDPKDPKYLELLPMMRPGEPPLRTHVSMRVLVVDSCGDVRPRDIAVQVPVSGTVGDIVHGVRAQCEKSLSADSQVVLANVVYRADKDVNPADHGYPRSESKITRVYTSLDDSLLSKPAREVKGFARDFTDKSGYKWEHHNRGLGIGKHDPCQGGFRDILVAYVLPKDTKRLAVVNPTYHFDFKEISANAKKQQKALTEYDAKATERKAQREADDADYLAKMGGRYGYHHRHVHTATDESYARSQLKRTQYLGTLGIPIVVPAAMLEKDQPSFMEKKTFIVGGETQDADVAHRVKRILESCVVNVSVPSPSTASGSAGKGKRRAVADDDGPPKIHLPLPFLLHTDTRSHHTSFTMSDAAALDDVRLQKAVGANGEPVKGSFAKAPRDMTEGFLTIAPWDKKGYLVHGVTSIFDYAAMTPEAKALVKKDVKLLPGGAEKLATAVADDNSLPELYKRQSLEDKAAARSNRLIEELMRASVSFHIEIKPIDYARNPAARHPSRLRWKPFHPLVRTVVKVNPVRGSAAAASSSMSPASTDAELEIQVYVRNENFKKPADEATRLRLFNGPLSWTCRSLLDAPAAARVENTSSLFSQLARNQNKWTYWHSEDLTTDAAGHYGSAGGYSRHTSGGTKSGNGDALHETLTTLFWGDKLREFQTFSQRVRADGGARSIQEFMKKLEMPGRNAATQPVGLAVEMREYQLQSLARMLELENAPGGMRGMMWIEIPSVKANGAPAWFSPFFRMVLPQSCVPALPKGGFLCEEMGLGKTIEVLGLVLSNPPPANWVKDGDPVGTTCVSPSEHAFNKTPDGGLAGGLRNAPATAFRSTATLVVCAVSLVGQWIDEARSKLDTVNGLRIHMYHGQKRIRDPERLANDYDLVVTTYQTIASDRGKHGLNHPTAQVEWYRIVLDEAHMAKSAQTAQSKACHELRAARRWACTGTPMGIDINDLHGQLKFLGAYPCQTRTLFEAWFRNPLSRSGRMMGGSPTLAIELMSSITVRHAKDQTLNGRKILELPKKTETFVEVTLDKDERKKYLEIHTAAKQRYDDVYAAKGDMFISSKILSIMSLLTPLRRLCSGGSLTAEDLNLDGPQQRAADARRQAQIAAARNPDVKPGNLLGGAKAEPCDLGGDENAAPEGELGREFRARVNDDLGGAAVEAKPVVPAPADGADKACGICSELCESPMRTGCGHFFCTDCLHETTTRVVDAVAEGRGRGRGRDGGRGRGRGGAPPANGTCECPQVGCRALIDASAVVRRRAAPAAPVVVPAVNDEPDYEDVPIGALAAANPVRAPAAEDDEAPAPAVIESDSKLRVLVKELRAMRAASPANKALIFSQFISTLKWLQQKLPDEGFGFRTVSGSMPLNQRAAAIAAFQKDPPTTVFLLSMRSGAVGINLTSATHVFLVEPALNPALTEQAIGRSWRMGQVNEVSVKHLIVKNSVESNIVKLLAERKANNTDADDEAAAESTSKMSKAEVAGHLKADKQRLKKNELELLFSLVETRAAKDATAAATNPAATPKKKRGRA